MEAQTAGTQSGKAVLRHSNQDERLVLAMAENTSGQLRDGLSVTDRYDLRVYPLNALMHEESDRFTLKKISPVQADWLSPKERKVIEDMIKALHFITRQPH